MENFEEEIKANNPSSLEGQLNALLQFNKNWANYAISEDYCFVSITPDSGSKNFLACIHSQAFDEIINPALQKAMEFSLRMASEHTKSLVKKADIALGDTSKWGVLNDTVYTCSKCGSNNIEMNCNVNPNTMCLREDIPQNDDGYCYKCATYVTIKQTKK